MEALGVVPYCTSPEYTNNGENLTTLNIKKNPEDPIPDDTTDVANKEDPSRTESAEETGAKPGCYAVGSTNTPNLESATTGGVPLCIGDHPI